MAEAEVWRIIAFGFVFFLLAAWESVAPRRRPLLPKPRRWQTNLGLGILNQALLRLLSPVLLLTFAAHAQGREWGILKQLDLSPLAAGMAALLVLDLIIYLQHRLFHRLPWLWRLHRVHHSDMDFDVSTAVRFHPLEILVSMGIKLAAVALLGPPLWAVFVFELVLSLNALFSHGNIALPARLERVVRWLIVTPDMHRIHHSCRQDEMQCNFSFNLSCWDRLLGTYRQDPAGGHGGMSIGLRDFREPAALNLSGLLRQPLQADTEELL